jgi:hypothetical protein
VKHRLLAALTTATIGTLVFVAVGLVSHGLVGSPLEAAGCFFSALLSTGLVVRASARDPRSNSFAAAFVVFATFLGIAAAHAAEQPLVRGVAVDGEWRGLLFWAVVTTSWWLVPAAAWVLSVCNRRLPTARGDNREPVV